MDVACGTYEGKEKCMCVCVCVCVYIYICIYIYIWFKMFFYVFRNLDSVASYLPTGLHLGFFRSWRGKVRTSYFVVGKTERKEQRIKHRRRREDNIKVDLLISTASGCTDLQAISCKIH